MNYNYETKDDYNVYYVKKHLKKVLALILGCILVLPQGVAMADDTNNTIKFNESTLLLGQYCNYYLNIFELQSTF